MDLLTVVIVLIAVGIGLWALNKYGTMIDGNIKWIINVVVILVVVFWLLRIFGILERISSVHV